MVGELLFCSLACVCLLTKGKETKKNGLLEVRNEVWGWIEIGPETGWFRCGKRKSVSCSSWVSRLWGFFLLDCLRCVSMELLYQLDHTWNFDIFLEIFWSVWKSSQNHPSPERMSSQLWFPAFVLIPNTLTQRLWLIRPKFLANQQPHKYLNLKALMIAPLPSFNKHPTC